jgi:hypothetical protein
VTDPLLAAVTVNAIVLVADKLPLVPFTVNVTVPVAAELLAVNVTVEVTLPLAEGVTELGENDAVTPEGNPDTLKATAELNPPLLATVIVLAPDALCAIDKLLGESDSEKDAVPVLVTVSAIVVLAERLPLVPVMVTVDEPAVAELLALSVNTLDPVVGLVPNDAVTPLGRPLAASVTLPLNPPAGFTVTVLVPDAPCAIDKLPGESDSVNEADCVPQAPCDVHGWPLPAGPLLVAGLFPCVQ